MSVNGLCRSLENGPSKRNVVLTNFYSEKFFLLDIETKGVFMLKTPFILFCVIRLGLEPKTPSLKGMCSTC